MIFKKVDYENTPEHISKIWSLYLATIKRVYPFLKTAYKLVKIDGADIKTAYDIGCGSGYEANYLVEKGIKLTAVDYNIDCLEIINSTFPKLQNNPNFNFLHSKIENLELKPVDLIVSLKLLPFLSEEELLKTLNKFKRALNKNGYLMITFFGENDGFDYCSLMSKKEIASHFKDYEILLLDETEVFNKSVSGAKKNFHLIELVAKKR